MNKFTSILPVSASQDGMGRLTIAGHCVHDLADTFGTPLYLYDGATVRDRIKKLKQAGAQFYPASFEITYASKAYLSLGFARHLAALGVGVDVVSLGELMIALKGGFAPEKIHLHGNNKSEKELETALDRGIHSIVVDSLEELALLEAMASRKQKQMCIWLRITPGVDVDTHPYLQTANFGSKFGLPMQDGQAAEGIRRAMQSPWLKLTGLHTHIGSQIMDAAPYRKAVQMLVRAAEEQQFIPQELSVGGGWGVPYLPDQKEADQNEWVQTLSSAVAEEYSRRGWELPELVLEPGRWIAARAGVSVYQVGTVKPTPVAGWHFVAVDGGLADNPRPALYQAQYTAFAVDRPQAEPLHKAVLVGKYCESGDVIIPEVDLPEVKRGDLLAIPCSGAYQLSMASNYNLAPRPAVLWLESDQVEVMQKRETVDEAGWWLDAS